MANVPKAERVLRQWARNPFLERIQLLPERIAESPVIPAAYPVP